MRLRQRARLAGGGAELVAQSPAMRGHRQALFHAPDVSHALPVLDGKSVMFRRFGVIGARPGFEEVGETPVIVR